MTRKVQRTTVMAFLLMILLQSFSAQYAAAALEWTQKKQLKLDESPLDVAVSTDGKWVFVLSHGEILVYSGQDDQLLNRIPVDKGYDRLAYAAPDNSLIVTSSADKAMKVIKLESVHRFSLEGLPFEGEKNAPVTLVVFSDYQ